MNNADRKTRPCSHCGQAFAPEQLIPFQDELLCPACLDEQTTVCSCCGERIYKTDNSGTDTIPLCEDCYDNHYERCTHCGALIHRRDTYYRGMTLIAMTATTPCLHRASMTTTSSRSRFSMVRASVISAWSWRLTRAVSPTATPNGFWILPTPVES